MHYELKIRFDVAFFYSRKSKKVAPLFVTLKAEQAIMSAVPKKIYTVEEYLQMELTASYKSEYYKGDTRII